MGDGLGQSPAATLQQPAALDRRRGASAGREVSGLAWGGLGLVLALVAQAEAWQGRQDNAITLFLVAAVVYLRSRPRLAFRPTAPRFAALSSLGRDLTVFWLLAALVLGAQGLLGFRARAGELLPWAFYLSSLGCLGAAAHVLRGHRGEAERPRGREWLWLTLILAWGAFMRLHRLESFPAGIYFDEATNAMEGLRAVTQRYFPPYFPGELGYYGRFGALYEYWVGGALSLWGSNELSLRLTAVFPALLLLPLFYLLAREFFDRPVAMLATLLLATSRWHTNFSRIAFDAVLVPTVLVAAMLFLVRAVHRGWRGGYILAGICVGLGLMSYTAFRLAPLLLVAVVPIYLLFRRLPPKEALIGLALLGLSALIASTPEVYHYFDDPESFTERTRRLSIVGERPLWEARHDIAESLRRHLGMFNLAGDRNGRHNLPGAPLLHPVTGALFVLGAVGCLTRWRRPQVWVLGAWMAAMLPAGVLSVLFEAPQALRTIGVIPAVYLIAAVPLQDLWGRFRGSFGARRWYLLAPALAVGIAWLLVGSYDTFFRVQASNFAVWNGFSTPETRMALAIRERGQGRAVYVDPVLHGQPTVRFLLPDFAEPDPYVPQELLPLREVGPEGAQVFVWEQHRSLAQLLARWYPGATLIEHANPADGHASMYELVIAPEDIEQTRGLEMHATWPGESGGSVPAAGLELDLEEGLVPEAITWQGVLVAPESGYYRFHLEAPGEVALTLDGAAVAGGGQVYLARGRHDLRAQVLPTGPGPVRVWWQRPSGNGYEPVAEDLLFHAPIEPGGLQGDYLPGSGDDWSLPEAGAGFSRVDPWVDLFVHKLPLERPYRVRWHGWLVPPMPGQYVFTLTARDRAQLWLDGQLVLETTSPDVPAVYSVALSAAVPIEVRFWDETGHTRVKLRWLRPDRVEEVVPHTALLPPAPVVVPASE
ncbi:MAG: PA14 domain-containing protein [Anaerolineae bacterium]